MTLYCATGNAGKLREIRRTIGAPFSLETLPGLESMEACEETGTTFEENAVQKAVYYSRGFGGLLFAEDSGLEVEALNRAPGAYSARFAGPGATDEDNNSLLLEKLRGEKNRRARYVAVAALARDGAVLATFRGEVEGRILEAPRGTSGFGYDPLFYYPPFASTFAEALIERKLEVSHRTKALTAMLDSLRAIQS